MKKLLQNSLKTKIKLILFITFYIFVCINSSKAVDEKKFALWKTDLINDAKLIGISNETLDKALKDVKILTKVIELDRTQPEKTISFEEYNKRVNSKNRINSGKDMFVIHKDKLDKISQEYNVQPRFIVAIWGIETSYGGYIGNFPIISSLVSLAFEGRRANFFRKELLNALEIMENEGIDLHLLKGSWAGAMGQSQFMPSSFIQYAQDFNKDGFKNIWENHEDIFASIAHYLHSHGWNENRTWGREVIIDKKNINNINLNDLYDKPLTHWESMVFKKTDGKNLPKVDIDASLLMPDGINGKKFLVYSNFKTIKRYNNSNYYALSVGILSDGVKR